jgi:hypothetical protein
MLGAGLGLTRALTAETATPASGAPVTGSGLSRLQALPLPAQGEISTSLGSRAAAFAAKPTGGGFSLSGGGIRTAASGTQVTFGDSRGSASMTLARVGRGDRLASVGSGELSAHGNRVVDTSSGLSTWYAAGPLGIEQGFTLARRPAAGHGELTLALRLGGALRARRVGGTLELLTRTGAVAFRYGGLSAVDAHGRRLTSSLTLRGHTVLLRVADRSAQYPVKIDPFVQQGSKLANPSGDSQYANFGYSAAVSADGSTAVIGGPESTPSGVVWVYVKSGGTWTQQQQLIPSDEATGNGEFGLSVALSADGDTALVGDPEDNTFTGAAWVFTRTGTTWTQDGAKLTGGTSKASFGNAVALSGDGTSALIAGAAGNNNSDGGVWSSARSGTSWTAPVELSTPAGSADFGSSLAMSADGSTALIGDDTANSENGVAWVYTHSGQSWTEQAELTPAASVTSGAYDGAAEFGSQAALSADGDTALVGAAGAATGSPSVFVRSGTSWTQQALLVPSDEGSYDGGDTGDTGGGLALSADGNTALVGLIGADGAWVFGRSGTSWVQEQAKLTPNDSYEGGQFGSSVALSSDGASAVITDEDDDLDAGAAWSFTDAPTATTNAASGVNGADATLNGALAAGPASSVFFQYGTSTAYGSQTATQTLASSGASTPVSAALTGLAPGTTYHYREVAENSAGTTDGADQTFTTTPSATSTVTTPTTTTPPVTATTRVTTATVDDQTLKLISPAPALCTAVTGKLKLSLSTKKLTKGTKLTFLRARVYLDKGIAHRRRERVHGKLKTVTTYTANATVTRRRNPLPCPSRASRRAPTG